LLADGVREVSSPHMTDHRAVSAWTERSYQYLEPSSVSKKQLAFIKRTRKRPVKHIIIITGVSR